MLIQSFPIILLCKHVIGMDGLKEDKWEMKWIEPRVTRTSKHAQNLVTCVTH